MYLSGARLKPCVVVLLPGVAVVVPGVPVVVPGAAVTMPGVAVIMSGVAMFSGVAVVVMETIVAAEMGCFEKVASYCFLCWMCFRRYIKTIRVNIMHAKMPKPTSVIMTVCFSLSCD